MTIETKYNIGDKVWVSNENNIFKGSIIAMGCYCYFVKILYLGNPYFIRKQEDELFPTKEELLKSL